jgi:tRNA-specific 2-thiouridylase
VLLPIGHLTKAEVRRRAADLGLRTAEKPESQDVCFVTRAAGREAFLADRIPLHPARVVDADGVDVGSVDAVETVTIGQRRGLRLAGGGARRFVTRVDVPGRTVTVGSPDDLLVEAVHLTDVDWAAEAVEMDVLAQCSAHGSAEPAEVLPLAPGTAELRWREPRRAVAPGQSVVLYDAGERCGAGGPQVVVAGGIAAG